jgi:hypothetical protein
MGIMSSRLVLLNAILVGVVAYFAFGLTRDLSASRPLPERPARQAASVSPSGPAGTSPVSASARPDERALYGWIAAKNLSSPSRAETVTADGGPGATPAAAKPFLHGVVLDDTKSRAYLEDPASKKVFGYVVGDSVGGGRLDAIRADRVVIVRPEGPVEVMVGDPSKPQPTATVTAGVTVAAIPSSLPGLRPTPSAGPSPGLWPVPGTGTPGSPAPPLPLQSIPPDFLRRSPVLPQPEEAR